MTHNTGGAVRAWKYIGKPERAPRFSWFICASVVLLAAAQFFAAAAAQELSIPAGPVPGELKCPYHRHSTSSKAHGRPQELLEPPSNEELAALPEPNEAGAQEVNLDGPEHLDASRPMSIGLWGDSHAAAAYFSEELVRALGLTPGKVQPTFIPPTMDRSGVRLPLARHCQSGGWEYEYAYVAKQPNTAFAKGLVNLRSDTPESYLWVDFRLQPMVPSLRALDILFAPPVAGAKNLVGIAVDDGAEQVVELEQGGQGAIRIHAEQAMSTVKLRLIQGALALQGFVPHYVEQPELYFDTLGIPGATARGWKAADAGYLKQKDGGLAYDMVILEYGTNEGNDRNFDPEKYRADLRASLHNLRQAYPESLCVLMGPTDRGVLVRRHGRKGGSAKPRAQDLLKYSRIHQKIGSIQRDVGMEYSCSYWSWQAAMGGPGGVYRWLRHSPALMARDLIHLTVPGYQLSARKFVSEIRLLKVLRGKAN